MSSFVFFCNSSNSQSSSSSKYNSDICKFQNKSWLKGASNKNIFGNLRIFDKEFEFEVWKPGTWNKFCIKVNLRKDTASLTINSKLIKSHKIEDKFEIPEENILLMNTQDKQMPFRERFIEQVFVF